MPQRNGTPAKSEQRAPIEGGTRANIERQALPRPAQKSGTHANSETEAPIEGGTCVNSEQQALHRLVQKGRTSKNYKRCCPTASGAAKKCTEDHSGWELETAQAVWQLAMNRQASEAAENRQRK